MGKAAQATILVLALLTGLSQAATASDNAPPSSGKEENACSQPGHWIGGHDGKISSPNQLFNDLANRDVILLGETHDRAEHHSWQLHTLAAVSSRSEELVIGFEMFPRRVQPVLDQWVSGELTEKAFLKAVNWQRSWGYDANLYMPLFDFARMHRIQMIALNVDRELVSKVGAEGWNAIPIEEREGLSDPAEASPDYEQSLAQIYLKKMELIASGVFPGMASLPEAPTSPEQPSIADILERPEFKRFVSAQLTWDRAMAEGLAKAKQKHDDAVVAGVMGTGHLAHFHGVPHQLNDLGLTGSAVLIPVEAELACDRVGTKYADQMFTLESPPDSDVRQKQMRLGVMVRDADQAALVDRIVPDSVAEAIDLREGDRIIRAAGTDILNSAALVEVLARQAPGTWLPITVERAGATVDLVAKFPVLSGEDY